jgi:GntR family transcriptional regulator/MocR family aminotransferase
MRMGYMILPEHLMETYEEKLGKLSCSVPVLDQYVLAEFIENGSFERYLNRMRRQMHK